MSTIKFDPSILSTVASKTPDRERYHHGNLRAAITAISLDLIAEKGVRALTLREIGIRLGVSRMAPYRHFADKAALLASLGAEGFRQFGDVLDTARRAASPSFLDQLDAMGAAYVRFASEHRAHFEVMFGMGDKTLVLDPEGDRVAERAFGILEETIRHGQAAGEIVEGDSVELARMVWSLVHGISLLGFGSGAEPQKGNAFTQFCLSRLRTGVETKNLLSDRQQDQSHTK